MTQGALVAALALFAGAGPSIAEEPPGHGPWRLGMSRDEVAAVESHGPYEPVASTGGLETHNGRFQGQQITVSFVFGSHGLEHIQLWAYTGEDLDSALEAFHSAYLYLSSRCGPLHSDGEAIPEGLSAADLERLIPAHFKTGNSESLMPELKERGSFQAQVHKLHLHPRTPCGAANVYGSFIHSPQLGLYWVFVYVKSPPSGA